MSLAVMEEVGRDYQLPAFPTAASRLLSACNSGDVSTREIAEIIACDPGLAQRVLKLSNSSMYGYAGRIRTVSQAVVVLGMRSICNISVAVAGADVFNGGSSAAEERSKLWDHSLACGVISRCLAAESNTTSPDEAFLAGVFHDVGKLVFYDITPDDYAELAAETRGRAAIECEAERFGTTHPELGVHCATKWKLPRSARASIGAHHEENPADEGVRITAMANCVAHSLKDDSLVDSFASFGSDAGEVMLRIREEAGVAVDDLRELLAG